MSPFRPRDATPRPNGRRTGLWWMVPVAVVAVGALTFTATEAPRWTDRASVPLAITVRPDAQVTAAPRPVPPPAQTRHHAPRPKPTPTVTKTEILPASTPVPLTVVSPRRTVIETPTVTKSHSDDGGHDDQGSDDGRHKHGGHDN